VHSCFSEPCEALRPFIKTYLHVKAEGSTDVMPAPENDPRFVNGKHVERILPGWGMMVIMNNCVCEIDGRELSGAHIIGPHTGSFTITTLRGWFEALVVQFNPGGLHALMGYNMAQMRNKVFTDEDLHDMSLHQLEQRMLAEEHAETCLSMFDAFFLGRVNVEHCHEIQRIEDVMRATAECDGVITVQQMADVTCLCERQFRRVFSEQVGLTPKEFVQLYRFHCSLQHMINLAHQGMNVDLYEVAHHFGYYDLSHMAADYRRFGCVSPAQFRRMGIPLSSEFSAFFG